jgi:probable DNA metabolism protein
MEAKLASETDLAGFREEARVLLAQQVPPEAVEWRTARAQNCDLFADPVPASQSRPNGVAKAASAIVPASFLRLCELVVLHHDPDRFALLYRLLWRLVYEPGLRHDPIDGDMLHAHQMGQSVRRDIHKMKATLKFMALDDDGAPLQLAWYEPSHHVLETVAPWFAKRQDAGTPWAIFTPERSVRSDGQLHYAPGLQRAAVPGADAPESDWLPHYHGVFGKAVTP